MQRGTKWIARMAAAALAASVLAPGWRVPAAPAARRPAAGQLCEQRLRPVTAGGRPHRRRGAGLLRHPASGPSSRSGPVTGLTGDTALVGIDFRPATGALVGLGNQGGIYTIDPATGVATNRVQLSEALSGTSFGVDFNPTVDRLRIVSDTGQNLRANLDTGVAHRRPGR